MSRVILSSIFELKPSQCHQMTHGGGGWSKIGQKSVTYYLNGPKQRSLFAKGGQKIFVSFKTE